MKKTVLCDICGIELNANDAFSDISGERDYCKIHYIATKLDDAMERRDNKAQWLEETHLKELRELDAKILELEASLKYINNINKKDGETIAQRFKTVKLGKTTFGELANEVKEQLINKKDKK